MATHTGQCPKCFAINAYTAANCIECGTRLPWADALQASAPTDAPLPVGTPSTSIADEIQKIQALYDRGALTDEEFAAAKAQALKGSRQRAQQQAAPQQIYNPLTPRVPSQQAVNTAAKGFLGVWSCCCLGPVALFIVLLIISVLGGALTGTKTNTSSPADTSTFLAPVDPTATAAVTGVAIAPFTTAQGRSAQIVQTSIQNTCSKTIYSVFADVTIFDAAGNVIDTATGQCVYATYDSQPGLAPGATYAQSGTQGWINVEGPAVRGTAIITKIKTQRDPR